MAAKVLEFFSRTSQRKSVLKCPPATCRRPSITVGFNNLGIGGTICMIRLRTYIHAVHELLPISEGWAFRTGPSRQELRLRQAQRSSRLDKLVDAMETMPEGKEWCTRTPHFEGDEVFGSTAHQLNLPLGSQFDSHRLDKMNFSCPRV